MFLLGIISKLPGPKKVKITKIQINPCRGCYGCWEKNPGKCGVTDDFQKIINEFLEADLVVWSLPMFYYGAPSIMKAFTERLMRHSSKVHPSKVRQLPDSQRHVIISACSFQADENHYETEIRQFDVLFAGKYIKILCPQGELFNIPQMNDLTTNYLRLVKRAGAEYGVYGKFSAKTKEQLSKPLLSGEALVKLKK